MRCSGHPGPGCLGHELQLCCPGQLLRPVLNFPDQLDKTYSNLLVQEAARRVQESGASWNSARGGKLDKALGQLDAALDPTSTAGQRLHVLARLTATLQAQRLLAARPVITCIW